MKASNSDLEELWQSISYAYEQWKQPIPWWLGLARRVFRALLLIGLEAGVTAIDSASTYLDRRLWPVPILPREKNPNIEGWTALRLTNAIKSKWLAKTAAAARPARKGHVDGRHLRSD